MEVIRKQGFVWVGANLQLRSIKYPLYILLLTIVWFYYQCDLWSPAHISTIANDFLNDSDCFLKNLNRTSC